MRKWRIIFIAVITTVTCAVWLGLPSAPAGAQTTSTTMVTDNAGLVSTGGTLIFTATVTGSGGTPAGTVAWTGVTCTSTTPLSAGVATCSISDAQASTAYTATASFTDTDGNYTDSSSEDGPVSPSTADQATLSITSTSGIYATALTLTTSGGTGTGAVSYAVDTGGAASGCAVSSGSLTSTSAGTCIVTAAKAADADYNAISSVPTTITLSAATSTTKVFDNAGSVSTGGTLVFIATVSGPGGTPAGTVGWTGVTCTSTTPLSAGVATCSISDAQASTAYAATATFTDTDGNYTGSMGSDTASVDPATPTPPTISNLPVGGGTIPTPGNFTAVVSTNGDGMRSVTSNTPFVCTSAGLSVTYVSAGTCSLTAHVTAGPDYESADGTPQTFSVYRTPTAPSISNIPPSPVFGRSFIASVSTTGNGTKSVSSTTPGVCTVGADGLTVSFVGVGTCVLTPMVAQGTLYRGATGTAQTFSVARAAPSTPTVTNIPTAAVEFAGFTADVATTGDGATSVVSNTPAVCGVESDGLTVLFLTTGACTVTPSVGPGVDYLGATGRPQTFQVGPAPRGYWLVGSDGGIFSFGAAAFHGSMGGVPLQRPVVGITPTITRDGYWLVASDGGIFSFGDATFYGSVPGVGLHPAGSGLPNSLDAPIVGMVPSVNRRGYFMVASDGGVFAFGDANFEGSCPGIGGCPGTAVAVMPDHTGNGYWLVTNSGGVYSFGDAPFYGAPGAQSARVVNAVATPDGSGYWLLYANGAVASFGDAVNFGSPTGYVNSFNPANAIFPTADGNGYWVASTRGDVFAYGNAPWLGSMTGKALNGDIIAGFGF